MQELTIKYTNKTDSNIEDIIRLGMADVVSMLNVEIDRRANDVIGINVRRNVMKRIRGQNVVVYERHFWDLVQQV